MYPGLLNKRVTIQALTQGQDATGALLPSAWADVATVWASVRDISGRQYVAAKAGQNAVSTIIGIRHRTGIVPAMRVIHNGDVYDIEAVLNRSDRWIDLMAVKGVGNG